jgi:UDPglucose--hexose-1-phosphate uridylyltransferase
VYSEEKQNNETQSELRQDPVTGDWVVIATGRAKRPEDFSSDKKESLEDSISTCPFEDPEATGQEEDVLIYRSDSRDWSLRVFPNKYPAISRGKEPRKLDEGPYHATTGTGYHEVVVPRDHSKSFALLEVYQIAEVFDAYQDRYLELMNKKSIDYISIIHNHGKRAGASLAHPHSQIIAIPVISPYINLELAGSKEYKKRNKSCVYCTMIQYEVDLKTRVVYENSSFVVLCPYASRSAFEMWVLPKDHESYFERMEDENKLALAESIQNAMSALFIALDNPDYNFYIHTSPCDGKDYPHYHWHIEILPRTAVWAGFELSTGIEISTIEPEKAAEFLRRQLQ